MGIMLKTTFWLGLVLTAMPLGETPKVSDILSPAQQAAACTAATEAVGAQVGSAADAYRGLAAMGCASFAGALNTAAALRASNSPPGVASPRALTENDRKPPWLGPLLSPERPKEG